MGLLLYVLTALCDLLSVWFRFWIGDTLIGSRFADPLVGRVLGLVLAFGPWAWSLAALVGARGGDGLTRFELRGRAPTDHERGRVEAALDRIGASVRPRRWFVIDHPMMHAYVVGDVLYIQRGLIDDEVLNPLDPILAHQLGHLANKDGRMVLALRRLPFAGCLAFAGRLFGVGDAVQSDRGVRYGQAARTSILPLLLSALLFVFAGGLGAGVLVIPWKRYWQECERRADRFAREHGLGVRLAEALRQLFNFDIAVPFMQRQPLVLNRARVQALREPS